MSWLPRETVVVPIDFSDDSFAALAIASELVSDLTHLHVIHVLPHLEPADPGVIWHTIDDEGRRQHAQEVLSKQLQQRGLKVEKVQIAVRIGDPGHEIVQFAEEVDAGLIVVASQGRSALQRLLIGSVAERVVRFAHCAVLVLKCEAQRGPQSR